MRTLVREALYSIFSKPDSHSEYSCLSDSERELVVEILLRTRENLPPIWKAQRG